jgi:hypothetical protein
MSGRPGKIIGEVTVPFKRPHDARFFSKKTFLELEIKLSRLLEIALKSKDTL